MPDPRFDNVYDQEFVQKIPGWYTMEHVGELRGGTSYSDDPVGWDNDSRWLEFYANQTIHVSSPHLARFYLKISGTSATSMEGSAVRAETYIDPTGNVLSGQAVHAELKLGTTGGGASGYLAALRGIVTVEAATRTMQNGVVAGLFLTNNIATGNTEPTRTSFIAFEDLGAVKANYLFDLYSIGASGTCWETDSGAVGTVLGYAKVTTPAGEGYLVVYADHS